MWCTQRELWSRLAQQPYDSFIHTEPVLYLFLCLCFHPFILPRLALLMTNTLSASFILDCSNKAWKSQALFTKMHQSLKTRYIWGWKMSGGEESSRKNGWWKKNRRTNRVMCWLKLSFRLYLSMHSHTHTWTHWVRGQWWVVRLWLHARLNRMGP